MVTPLGPLSPVGAAGPAPSPPPSAAPPAAGLLTAAQAAALLAGLPPHSPLSGLRQDPGITHRLTGPGPHAGLRAALLHHGGTLEGLRQLRGDDPPGPPAGSQA